MIFVTVGTHEQPFNRLVMYIDKLKETGVLEEDIIIQTGYCTYEPKFCLWRKLFQYEEMIKYVNEARIVITHGGPSSFIMPLQIGKIPVVVPRQKEFGEHVNNHQVDFAKAVATKQRNIIIVEDIDNLKDIILDYGAIIETMTAELKSNNKFFNDKLEKVVMDIFRCK